MAVRDGHTRRTYDLRPLFVLARPGQMGSFREVGAALRDAAEYLGGAYEVRDYTQPQIGWLHHVVDAVSDALLDVRESGMIPFGQPGQPTVTDVYDLVTLTAYDAGALLRVWQHPHVGSLDQLYRYTFDAAHLLADWDALEDASVEEQESLFLALIALADACEAVHASAYVPTPWPLPKRPGQGAEPGPSGRVLRLPNTVASQRPSAWHRLALGSDGAMLPLFLPHIQTLPLAA